MCHQWKKMWRQALPNRSICTHTTQFNCFPCFISFSQAQSALRLREHQMNRNQQQSKRRKTIKKTKTKKYAKKKSPNRRFVFLLIFFSFFLFCHIFVFCVIFRRVLAIAKRFLSQHIPNRGFQFFAKNSLRKI